MAIMVATLRSVRSARFPALRSLIARSFSTKPEKVDLGATDVTLQKARTWDEGEKGGFTTTSLADVFGGKKVAIFGLPGAFTGVCTKSHVPSYVRNVEAFKARGVDSVVCVAVNDPYVMKAWAKVLQAEGQIDFYGDFSGKFNESLGLSLDLSGGLLGHRSTRWSALVDNGQIKFWNVEDVPSNFKVSSGDYLLKQLEGE